MQGNGELRAANSRGGREMRKLWLVVLAAGFGIILFGCGPEEEEPEPEPTPVVEPEPEPESNRERLEDAATDRAIDELRNRFAPQR